MIMGEKVPHREYTVCVDLGSDDLGEFMAPAPFRTVRVRITYWDSPMRGWRLHKVEASGQLRGLLGTLGTAHFDFIRGHEPPPPAWIIALVTKYQPIDEPARFG